MKRLLMLTCAAAIFATLAASALAAVAYDEVTISVIETRPCDVAVRAPDNPGGWIETRLGDNDAGSAPVDTLTPISIVISFR